MLNRVRRLRPAAFFAGFLAAIVLTGGGAAAYAANGGSLLIGRSNYGTAPTSLANSAGTPLKLYAKTGYPPLAVNSKARVTNLGADFLDGLSEASFARAAGQTGNVIGGSEWRDVDADGTNDTIVSWATCPAGTKLTGGGNENYTTGITFVDYPENDTWVAVTNADPAAAPTPDVPADLVAWAVCYHPRGAVPGAIVLAPNAAAGAATAKSSSDLSPALEAKIAKAAAKHTR
jgi:hypothetical protein